MKSILIHKECKVQDCKNTSVSVRGENPYCREHVHSICELKYKNNIFNECRCNSTVSMISCGGKQYCNAHYRTLIYKCNHKKCKKIRKNNKLSFDKKWYCKKHHKQQNNKFLSSLLLMFRDKIPYEITEKICKIHLKKNTCIL